MARVASTVEDPYRGFRFRLSKNLGGHFSQRPYNVPITITKINVYWGLHWGPPIWKLLYYMCIVEGGICSSLGNPQGRRECPLRNPQTFGLLLDLAIVD